MALKPGCANDVDAVVPLLTDRGLARVEPHPDAHGLTAGPRVLRMLLLHLGRGGDCIAGAGEGEEERVTLGVDLDAAVQLEERRANDAAMLGEQLRVAIAESLQECGRAFDVREDEGDRAGGQRRHARIVATKVVVRHW